MGEIAKDRESTEENTSGRIDDNTDPSGVAIPAPIYIKQGVKSTVRPSNIKLLANLASHGAEQGLKATVTVSSDKVSLTFERPMPETAKLATEDRNSARPANRPGQPVAKPWN